MSASAFFLVAVGVIAHVGLGRMVDPAWLMPDLTLLSIVLAMRQSPNYPMGAALVGGCLTALIAASQAWLAGLAYLGAGGLVRWFAQTWDLSQRSIQLAAIAAAEAFLVCVWLLAAGRLSVGLVLLAIVKVAATSLCMPIAYSLMRSR